MKIKSVLKSNHDLKKNGYRVLRKLHKLEKRNGAEKAYAAALGESYGFVLYCRALAEIIKIEYPDFCLFGNRCDDFLNYLEKISLQKSKIDKSVLSAFLKAYTGFFNKVIDEGHGFIFDKEIIELWNIKCLMAYVATWGRNR